MFRITARVPRPEGRFDYVGLYFNSFNKALDKVKELLSTGTAETVEIDKVKTED